MAKVKVYNMNAEEVGSISLKDNVFGVEYNEPLIHEVVVAYNANQRQGNKSTLTRSEVRGHAAKPYRQKGTGNARQGSTKGPHYTGGGVVFAPKPRDFSKKVNKVKKQVALLSALSARASEKQLTILDKFEVASAKTKDAQKFLDAFKFSGSVLVVTANAGDNELLASRNISSLQVASVELLNAYDVVANKNVVLTQEAVKYLEEVAQ